MSLANGRMTVISNTSGREFLRKVHLTDKVRSCEFREALHIEPVAYLEWKNWGWALRGQGKSGADNINVSLVWSSSSADVYLSSLLQPVTSLLCKHSGYSVSLTQTESW